MVFEQLVTWNPNGLQSGNLKSQKINKITNYLLNPTKLNVLVIVETHFRDATNIPQKLKNFQHLYHIQSTFATSADTYAGITVFINKKFQLVRCDELIIGRLLFCQIKNSQNHTQNFFFYYGNHRNLASRELHITISQNFIVSNSLEDIFYLGDFNYTISALDRNSNQNPYPTLVQNWLAFEQQHAIFDTFRYRCPNKRLYSNTHKKSSKSRIDRIYVPSTLIDQVKNTLFHETETKGHKIVEAQIFKDVENGPGTFCFKNVLLKDETYNCLIKNEILMLQQTKKEYVDKVEFWESMLSGIKQATQEYSTNKNQNFKQHANYVQSQLEALEALPKHLLVGYKLDHLEKLRDEQTEINEYKLNGLREQLKIPHVEDREFNISYLTRLQKQRIVKNNIFDLKDDQGVLHDTVEGKQKIVYKFYQNLYNKEATSTLAQDKLLKNIKRRVPPDKLAALEAPITEEEVIKAFKDMPNNKSPGINGFTKEFFVHFWDQLKDDFMKMLREVEKTKLGLFQRMSLIRILFKKGAKYLIKNYRPISLINVDVKAIAKVLATRLAKVLPTLVHHNQKCIPGRNISDNLHAVNELIQLIDKEDKHGALIFLDQEKAFDRVDHGFLFKTLKAFGLGPNFINWVKVLYKDIQSMVKVNGSLTKPINITRGVRQGCPLSALLYILVAEVCGIAIRANKNIVGFKYGSYEHKILQYADDTTICVTTYGSIKEVFNVLKVFEEAAGARINKDKTEGLWIGSWKNFEPTILNYTAGINWTSKHVKFLGIYVGNNQDYLNQLNTDATIEDIKTNLKFWRGKYLSKKGIVRVINTYVLSKLWYKTEVINLLQTQIKTIEDAIFSTIWNGKLAKINRQVLKLPYNEGGLALTDINTKIISQRLKWLSKVYQMEDDRIEKFLASKHLGIYNSGLGSHIKGTEILKYRIPTNNIQNINNFYSSSLNHWYSINPKLEPYPKDKVGEDYVFFNPLLLDDGNNLFQPPKVQKCSLLSHLHPEYPNGIPQKVKHFPPKGNHLFNFQSITTSVSNLQNDSEEEPLLIFTVNDKKFPIKTITSKLLYQISLQTSLKAKKPWEEKWKILLGNDHIEWSQVWSDVNKSKAPYTVQSTIWEQITGAYLSQHQINVIKATAEKCYQCKQTISNKYHFNLCSTITKIFNHFLPILNKIHNAPLSLEERVIGINNNSLNRGISLRNYITFIIQHITHKSRTINFANQNTCSIILIKKSSYSFAGN